MCLLLELASESCCSFSGLLVSAFDAYGFVRTGEKKCLNSELWHACAGPLVSLPPVGSRVVYFPQGHSEQVCCFTSAFVF